MGVGMHHARHSVALPIFSLGKVACDEVVQLYLKFPDVAGTPRIALRGFQRIHLEPGTSQNVHFDLGSRDLPMVAVSGIPMVVGGDYLLRSAGRSVSIRGLYSLGRCPRWSCATRYS